jgi:hypothetical protein
MIWQLFDARGAYRISAATLVVFHFSEDYPDWRFMIILNCFTASLFLASAIYCVSSKSTYYMKWRTISSGLLLHLKRATRPKVRAGYDRVEWLCVS